MKNQSCLKRSMRILGLGIRKATSYKMVKGRLSRGMYSDELLQYRLDSYKIKEEQVKEAEV